MNTASRPARSIISWGLVKVSTPTYLFSTDRTYREVSQTATTPASFIALTTEKWDRPILPAPMMPTLIPIALLLLHARALAGAGKMSEVSLALNRRFGVASERGRPDPGSGT